MLRHLVIFELRPDATPEQRQAIADRLAELPSLIPTIRSYSCGADLGFAEGNGDFGIVAEFDDEAGWRTYQDHPAHQAVIRDVIAPVRTARSAVQFAL